VLILLSGALFAQSTDKCIKFGFGGEVDAGEKFTRNIGSGLTFRLDPWNDEEGWEFEIGPTSKDPENPNEWDQYVYVLSPPYRFGGPRDINTGWGRPAQDAVKGEREFRFVITRSDASRAAAAIDKVLWPDSDEHGRENSLQILRSLPAGTGHFRVVDSKITPATIAPGHGGCDLGHCGQIHWIKFQIELVVPRSFALDPTLPATATRCGPSFPF
jgi:hypothetical protein